MALSTVKISDTIEWAKRFTFDRNPVIGNGLEPALTSANLILQTILGPPFEWWWNNEEITFTCNPTALVATITNITIAGGVLTAVANNSFTAGQMVYLTGVTTTTALNGLVLSIASASSTQFTANTTVTAVVSHADTGTATQVTTQDYTTANPEFSHIEHASVYDINQNPPKWYELEIKNSLSIDSSTDRPRFINPHVEDGSGNMTWRVMPAPDKAYPINIHVQLAAPRVTSVNQTWAPLPDFMQYIYSWGFLALMWNFADDPRFQFANQKFVAGLLARAEGIGDEEKNAFLNAWHGLTGHAQAEQQQGVQARGF